MTIGKTVFVFVSVYAPQANLSEAEKDRFYQMLQCTVATIPASEQLRSRSRVRVGNGYSEEFGVAVGVHQGSVLSPLLFIIVLEALSREFRTGCPWELLYADDLMISAESMEELLVKLKTWKTEMEKKGLRVNVGKTKIMVSGVDLDLLKKSGKDPCGSERSR